MQVFLLWEPCQLFIYHHITASVTPSLKQGTIKEAEHVSVHVLHSLFRVNTHVFSTNTHTHTHAFITHKWPFTNNPPSGQTQQNIPGTQWVSPSLYLPQFCLSATLFFPPSLFSPPAVFSQSAPHLHTPTHPPPPSLGHSFMSLSFSAVRFLSLPCYVSPPLFHLLCPSSIFLVRF